jgi:hypothetical protein
METRAIQSKKRYLWAFLIGTFIFIFGFVLTYSISYLEYQKISNAQEKVSYQIFKDKLYYSFFDNDVCSLGFFEKVTQDLRFHGTVINDLEKKLGKDNQGVLFQKKFYSLIELEHFQFLRDMNSKCGSNISSILFFYSNKDENIQLSEDTGKILDVVYSKNNNLFTYSFDINLDDDLISGLKQKYNVTQSPTIVINEKYKLVQPRNINEIENYL